MQDLCEIFSENNIETPPWLHRLASSFGGGGGGRKARWQGQESEQLWRARRQKGQGRRLGRRRWRRRRWGAWRRAGAMAAAAAAMAAAAMEAAAMAATAAACVLIIFSLEEDAAETRAAAQCKPPLLCSIPLLSCCDDSLLCVVLCVCVCVVCACLCVEDVRQ